MPRTRRRAAVAVVSGLLLTVAACSSSPSTDPTSPPPVTALPSETPTATADPDETLPALPSVEPSQDPTAGTSPDPTDPATEEPPAPPAPPSGGGANVVSVTTSYWGFDQESGSAFANGYADVVDEAGRCTLSLTKGSLTATAQNDATTDATTTSCGEITVPRSQLSSGSWQAVLVYTSPSSTGQSAPVEILVP